jgi:hypothetical protein
MRSRSRRGAVTIAVLILMPLLFVVLALALHAAELVRLRTALQTNADAAALAAAAALIDDSRLLPGSHVLPILMHKAREAAQASAGENIVGGMGITINPPRQEEGEDDEEDEPRRDADIEFGRKASFSSPFEVIRARRHGRRGLGRINAVQVWSRRTEAHGDPILLLRGPFLGRVATDAEARAVAMIERDVIGIRPPHGMKAPLVPLALLSDPKADDGRSWEYNVEERRGPDQYSVDRSGARPAPMEGASDGLHEMLVTVGADEANAVVLALGGASPAAQAAEGVSGEDLATLGGELVLGPAGILAVPAATPSQEGLEELAAALVRVLREGEPRVFPLYRQLDEEGRPVVSGFVAARVLAVKVLQEGGLRILLQPAMRSTPAIVTASSRGRSADVNLYLGRIRLAD